jgi:hypothetical protein
MMFCLHNWHSVGDFNSVCYKCHRSGQDWYDFLNGGTSLVRRNPIVDLRVVYG